MHSYAQNIKQATYIRYCLALKPCTLVLLSILSSIGALSPIQQPHPALMIYFSSMSFARNTSEHLSKKYVVKFIQDHFSKWFQ